MAGGEDEAAAGRQGHHPDGIAVGERMHGTAVGEVPENGRRVIATCQRPEAVVACGDGADDSLMQERVQVRASLSIITLWSSSPMKTSRPSEINATSSTAAGVVQ